MYIASNPWLASTKLQVSRTTTDLSHLKSNVRAVSPKSLSKKCWAAEPWTKDKDKYDLLVGTQTQTQQQETSTGDNDTTLACYCPRPPKKKKKRKHNWEDLPRCPSRTRSTASLCVMLFLPWVDGHQRTKSALKQGRCATARQFKQGNKTVDRFNSESVRDFASTSNSPDVSVSLYPPLSLSLRIPKLASVTLLCVQIIACAAQQC